MGLEELSGELLLLSSEHTSMGELIRSGLDDMSDEWQPVYPHADTFMNALTVAHMPGGACLDLAGDLRHQSAHLCRVVGRGRHDYSPPLRREDQVAQKRPRHQVVHADGLTVHQAVPVC